MRRFFCSILILCFALMTVSCSSNVNNEIVPSEQDESIKETENIEEGTDESQDSVGVKPKCQVHVYHYHFGNEIFGGIYFGVHPKEVSEWLNEQFNAPGVEGSDCPHSENYNVWATIHHFNIPRDLFEKACKNNSCFEYNPNVLYNDDPSVADEFYRNKHSFSVYGCKLTNFDRLVLDIIRCYGDLETEFRLSLTIGEYRQGILALVKKYNVPRSFFEDYPNVPNPNNELIGTLSRAITFNYNLDVIYNEDGSLKSYEDKTPYEIDCMFCNRTEFFIGDEYEIGN